MCLVYLTLLSFYTDIMYTHKLRYIPGKDIGLFCFDIPHTFKIMGHYKVVTTRFTS